MQIGHVTLLIMFLLMLMLSILVAIQRGVAHSSTKAEYRSVANTAFELRWIYSLLTELDIPLPTVPVIYCDNIGATHLSANPIFHFRMKHIALDYHFIRDNVQA